MGYLFGPTEVVYFQITPTGIQRIEQGQLRHLAPGDASTLRAIYNLGGTAELDELNWKTFHSPSTVEASAKHLVDLGLIMPVTAGPPAQVPVQPGVVG